MCTSVSSNLIRVTFPCAHPSQFSSLTSWVTEVMWQMIQQRLSSSLFFRKMWTVLAWAGISTLWCCPSSISSANCVANPPRCPPKPFFRAPSEQTCLKQSHPGDTSSHLLSLMSSMEILIWTGSVTDLLSTLYVMAENWNRSLLQANCTTFQNCHQIWSQVLTSSHKNILCILGKTFPSQTFLNTHAQRTLKKNLKNPETIWCFLRPMQTKTETNNFFYRKHS